MMELSFNPLLIGVPLPTCRLPELRVKLPRMFQSPSHRGTASNIEGPEFHTLFRVKVSIPFSSGYRFQPFPQKPIRFQLLTIVVCRMSPVKPKFRPSVIFPNPPFCRYPTHSTTAYPKCRMYPPPDPLLPIAPVP